MKTELAAKLKELLDKMSQEEFDKEWSEITALNLEGPSFSQVIEYFTYMPAESDQYKYNTRPSVTIPADHNYNIAA